jgi:hypothetical protein
LTGSPGRQVNPYFKKISKRHYFSKKKNQQIATGFCRVTGLTRRVSRVTPGYDFFYFFFNSVQF